MKYCGGSIEYPNAAPNAGIRNGINLERARRSCGARMFYSPSHGPSAGSSKLVYAPYQCHGGISNRGAKRGIKDELNYSHVVYEIKLAEKRENFS